MKVKTDVLFFVVIHIQCMTENSVVVWLILYLILYGYDFFPEYEDPSFVLVYILNFLTTR